MSITPVSLWFMVLVLITLVFLGFVNQLIESLGHHMALQPITKKRSWVPKWSPFVRSPWSLSQVQIHIQQAIQLVERTVINPLHLHINIRIENQNPLHIIVNPLIRKAIWVWRIFFPGLSSSVRDGLNCWEHLHFQSHLRGHQLQRRKNWILFRSLDQCALSET